MSQMSELQTCPILCLHEDLVHEIFSYLPQLCDKVRLACVAPNFMHVFSKWVRSRRHALNAEDVEQMQLGEMIDFFSVAGPYITSLTVDCSSFQKESLIVEFIAVYCRNLEEISYSNVTDDFHYRELMTRLTQLRRISIDCMDDEDVLNFDLEGNTGLESFELINGCYTGKHLCGFERLQRLVLRDCKLFDSGKFGIPLKHLRVLVLEECSMYHSLCEKIVKCCGELEVLSFSGCHRMSSKELNFLSTLADRRDNMLKYLKLSGPFAISNEQARYLGQLSALEELHLINVVEDDHFRFFNDLPLLRLFGMSFCGRVTDVGLMSLIRKCPMLSCINLKDCHQITDQFVLNAVYCCSKNLPSRDMLLNVEGTRINRDMLKHPEYLKPQNKVKLNFKSETD
ncbi:uncharacterized protein LOC132798248 [Drosophila nasuta]|uniref:uncharacterized protein LOC132798248 n=1 Tax=Drosophila nasuta TaxID=42062 RepID=UPI00295ECC12|nr:uncharacterized protein LOC132798248 [Drosophila nasuta]